MTRLLLTLIVPAFFMSLVASATANATPRTVASAEAAESTTAIEAKARAERAEMNSLGHAERTAPAVKAQKRLTASFKAKRRGARRQAKAFKAFKVGETFKPGEVVAGF